jgi:predicted nucleic acid-binding Zn ribbon protein
LDEKMEQKNSLNVNNNELILDERRHEELKKERKRKQRKIIQLKLLLKMMMTNKLLLKNSHQAIAAINNLINPRTHKVKIKKQLQRKFIIH